MRVISGTSRGQKLKTLLGNATRPTSIRVKESMMSAIQFEIEGARVADLFAGSGQLGIEALSRGARYATFVDSSGSCAGVIKENLTHTGLAPKAKVVKNDVNIWLMSQRDKFDIIFVDPPYRLDILPKLLPELIKVISDRGIIVCECDKDDILPDKVGGFSRSKDYLYGKRKLNIYRPDGE